jgi:hypothetical protein
MFLKGKPVPGAVDSSRQPVGDHCKGIVGPEPVRMVDVHANPRFITEWLDEDGWPGRRCQH